MKKEEFSEVLGEINENYVKEAHMTKAKTKKPVWVKWSAMAACLAVVVLAGVNVNRWMHTGHNTPLVIEVDLNDLTDSGGAADDLDGTEDSTDKLVQSQYSTDVEFGEIAVSTIETPSTGSGSSACLAWIEPAEIFAQDTVVFRGTVQSLRYFVVENGSNQIYRTVASVKVTDCVRGELGVGDIYNILLPYGPGESNSLVGDLDKLAVGSDAVFMPYRTTADTGEDVGSGYFCYADIAELYFQEGIRYLFLDTGDGLYFERDVYADIADAETLDEVVDYLREMVSTDSDQQGDVSDDKKLQERIQELQAADCLGWLVVENKIYTQDSAIVEYEESNEDTYIGRASSLIGNYHDGDTCDGDVYMVNGRSDIIYIKLDNGGTVSLMEDKA